MRVTSLDSKWETLNFSKRIFNVESGYLLTQRHSSFARVIHMKKYTFKRKHYTTLQRWIYSVGHIFVTEAKIFMLTSKSKNNIKISLFSIFHYWNIIFLEIIFNLSILILKNIIISVLKNNFKKMRFSNYWISINITIFSIYIEIYFYL